MAAGDWLGAGVQLGTGSAGNRLRVEVLEDGEMARSDDADSSGTAASGNRRVARFFVDIQPHERVCCLRAAVKTPMTPCQATLPTPPVPRRGTPGTRSLRKSSTISTSSAVRFTRRGR